MRFTSCADCGERAQFATGSSSCGWRGGSLHIYLFFFPKHDFFTSVLTLDRLQGDGNADEVARERAFNAEQEQEQEQEQGWYI